MKKYLLLKIYFLFILPLFFKSVVIGQCSVDFSFQQDAYDYKKISFTIDTNQVGAIGHFEWIFLDSNKENIGIELEQLNPVFDFPQEGVYEVIFVLMSNSGCDDTIIKNIEVKPEEQICFANFGHNKNPLNPNEVFFTDSSFSSSGIDSLKWIFGAGIEKYGTSINHVFPLPGYYNVCLQMTGNDGCFKQECKEIEILECEADFTFEEDSLNPKKLMFSEKSVSIYGNVDSWEWDFNDGAISSLPDPNHIYQNFGDYTIELIITTDSNCVDTIRKSVSINFVPPTDCQAEFSFDENKTNPTILDFFDNSSPGISGSVNSWQWTFGSLGTDTSQDPSYDFQNSGGYDVELVVFTTLGCTDTISKLVPVNNQLDDTVWLNIDTCLALFSVDVDSNNSNVLNFVSNSYSSDSILNYVWILNESIESYESSYSYQISQMVENELCLGIETEKGCKDTICIPINVDTDTLDFDDNNNNDLSPIQGCLASIWIENNLDNPLDYFFNSGSASASGDTLSHFWDIEGDSFSEKMFGLEFPSGGDKKIKLYVEGDGCSSDVELQLPVGSENTCAAAFTFIVDSSNHHRVQFALSGTTNLTGGFWQFGDSLQSNEIHPIHEFTNSGIYNVCVNTYDSITGCQSQVCDSVEVLEVLGVENCVAAFDYEVDGTQVNFTNQSQGNKLSIQYTFEDGTSSYDADPIKDFNQSGTYSVCINIFDSLTNCVSDSCVSITVLQDSSDAFCQADFEYTSLGSKKFSFHNTSIGAISAVTWEFNNGENIIRTADSIEFEFPNAGNFEVCLSIFDAASGCTNSICKTIEVVDTNSVNCRADFDFFIQNTGEVFFNSKAKGTYSHVYFSLGDGISKDSLAFSHTYQNSGHYDVCMSVYDEVSGCQDQYCELVVVNLDTSSVLCEARMDGFLDSENIVHTINQSIGDYSHTHWDFGDGSQSFENSPTHEFAASGYYTICLNIHDSASGCQSSICEEVNIKLDSLDVTCLADFEFIAIDEEVTVTNTSLGDNSHSHWSFGDGSYDAGSTASHSYNETGIYEVCLSTWDSVSGCQASVCKQVSIVKDTNEVFCEADFDYIPLSNGEIQFKDASIGNYTHVHWNLGNGIFSDTINPIGNYPNNGVYPVTIMIWDSISKCQASYTEEIAIAVNEDLVECHAKFEYFPINDSLVKFKSISLGNYSDINWDFGDGTFAEGESEVEHVFPHGGFFNVCVGIYDTQTGCHDFSCENVELLKDTTIVDCHANFEFFPTSDSEISFSNLSEGTFTQSFWKFSTGALSYDENPTIDFISGGLYGVCLTVFDEVSGCQDEYCVEVPIIHDTTIYCDAHFEYYVDYRTVKFEPEIKGNITGWTWDYNDGFNSNDSFPSYTYENDGVYEVCLTVFDSLSGCFNTYCDQVSVIGDIDEVDDYIQSDFSYFLDPIDGKVHFKDESVGNPSTWYWDFGDGDSAGVTQNPTYEYAEDGYYDVCLTARNNNGGQETKCQVIAVGDVSTACFAKFDYYANAVTATAHFDNKSLGNITGYNWNFGDSITSIQFTPSHTYADTGFYPVCLTVSNDAGCEQTFCKEIRVGNSLDNKCLIGCVWPGDANLDLEANHYDILPMGLHYGETGPSREEVDSIWKGYESQDWSSLLWGDVNNKHGDANGDGVINMDDILVIRENFAYSHSWQPRSNSENQLTIDWDADDIDVGATATLTVSIPDSLDVTMYGIGFEIDLDSSVYDYESIEYDFSNSFLGDEDTNLITFGLENEDEEKLYIAETRNDHEETTGSGVLVEITVTAKSKSTSSGAVLTTEGGVNAEGDTLEFNGDEDEVNVIGIEERDGYLVKDLVIFPNPTTGIISYNLPIGTSTDYVIEVFDNIGALVQSTNQLGGGKIEQNFEQFESGIYTIQVTNNKVKYLQKVIVSK